MDDKVAIVAETVAELGTVDIMVNNATAGAVNDLWNFTEEQWDQTIGVNLKGYFAMIRAAAPHMCRQGSGAIVNISSGSGFGHPAMIAYATAKEGVAGLTRTVAASSGVSGCAATPSGRPGAVRAVEDLADRGVALYRRGRGCERADFSRRGRTSACSPSPNPR